MTRPRSIVRTLVLALLAALVLHAHAPAQQPPEGSYAGGEVLLFSGDSPVSLRYRFEPARSGPGETVLWVGFEAGVVEARREGALLLVADTGPDGVFVAAVSARPASVATLFVRPSDAGREVSFAEVPRPAGRGREPVSVAVTRTSTGFTVLWQEASVRGPKNHPRATYSAQFDAAGRRLALPTELRGVPS